jgi:hypothetical protein
MEVNGFQGYSEIACRDETFSAGEFYDAVRAIIKRTVNRDLEEYLLALLALMRQALGQPMSRELILRLLEQAFTAEPESFDEAWLAIIEPPDDILESPLDPNDPQASAYSESVLKFQIAELHKMRSKQLIDDNRYFGLSSETGHDWYNFDPHTLLECGAAGLGEVDCSWSTLGELLEMGRIYE